MKQYHPQVAEDSQQADERRAFVEKRGNRFVTHIQQEVLSIHDAIRHEALAQDFPDMEPVLLSAWELPPDAARDEDDALEILDPVVSTPCDYLSDNDPLLPHEVERLALLDRIEIEDQKAYDAYVTASMRDKDSGYTAALAVFNARKV